MAALTRNCQSLGELGKNAKTMEADLLAYETSGRLFEIITIKPAATVKKQPKNKLKTSPKHKIGYNKPDFSGYRVKPYICYMHEAGKCR
jgi:hypothetical protein